MWSSCLVSYCFYVCFFFPQGQCHEHLEWHLPIRLYPFGPVLLLTVWLLPFPLVLLASATALAGNILFLLLTQADRWMHTPLYSFSASSLSWTWPWWAQWYPRWQPTLSQEVNSSLRAAVPLRSSKWSVLPPGSHGLWKGHGCVSHSAIGTLCSWNGRHAIWWPGILGEWSS